jgi:hypothetical protein
VFGGLNRLLVVAVAAAAVFVAPPAALACSGGVSAVNVYRECLQTGGGGKPTSGGGPTGGQSSTSTPIPISSRATKALQHVNHRDRRVLSGLVKGYGAHRLAGPQQSVADSAAPSAIGSAFDLGSGPTALLIALAGTAVLLLAATGVRSFRRR